jgi:hypothetical protein
MAATRSRPGNFEPRVTTMLGAERKAKLPASDFTAPRPTPPALESRARHVRVLDPVAPSVVQDPRPPQVSPASAPSRPAPTDPLTSDGAAEEQIAKQHALAADLEDMIGGMLRTTQFATAATAKTRSWSRQIGEVAALDASTEASAFTPNSLVADLDRSRPAPAAAAAGPAAPRRWWIDAVLVLACVLSVLSAGYFTFAP